ncbi:MAG: PKD domain-containing protein, partial [Chitinophagales bacterium]|nr:PKD domain-containing protein [Chitinophagales bacterium]
TVDGDLTYSWDFGDGTTSDEANPDHYYDHPGEYDVCLTITTADGCTAHTCHLVIIEGEETECVASFEFEILDNLGVHFFETVDGDVTYSWDFGDGTTSDEANPDHYYDHHGEYEVCLFIVTADGCEAHYCHLVIIEGEENDCVDESVIDLNVECITVYEPVCGCDGVTYMNECVAYHYHGILSWTVGECDSLIGGGGDKQKLYVYPNPAVDHVTLSYYLNQQSDLQIQLFDLEGKELLIMNQTQAAIGWHSYFVNTSLLSKGMYVVKLKAGDQLQTSKLVLGN